MDIIQEMILPTRKETLVDMVHNRIMEIIIQEDVSEESVFTEGKLVQQFEVSKATVREALVRLCSENILKSIPRYGYVIVRRGEKELEDIDKFRILLEIGSLRESFGKIGDRELQEMRKMLERHQAETTRKVWDTWKKNMEFHGLLVSFSGNQVYLEYLQRVMQRQAIHFGQSHWKSDRTFDDQLHAEPHRAILESLNERNLEKAVEVLEKDICWPSLQTPAAWIGATAR